MNIQYKFPKSFFWGAAASAAQTEGASREDGKSPSIWDYWYDNEPNRFFNKVGPEIASDFYHRYKEDIKLMKELNFNSYRTSISWSRLMPYGKLNDKAVSFYNNVINELINNGIEPFINLFHFDMPLEMQKIGGWENKKVVEAYAEYAKVCFQLFGDRVKNWITFNEPIVPVEGGYLYDFHYPNVVDFKKAVQVAYNTALANAKAIDEFKNSNMVCGKIGIVLSLSPAYSRSSNPADVKAGKIADLFLNKSFLNPTVKGSYPKELVDLLKKYGYLPEYTKEELDLIKNNTVDYLGVNYYQPRRVKAKAYAANPEAPFMPEYFFDNYEMPGRKMNPYRGWEIYEKGIYDIMVDLRDNYNNIQCFVSENGMGVEGEERYIKDGKVDDYYRIDFIRDHLKWLHKAISEGCNVKGYHLWTFIDNWSWTNAYKNRYGLISLDINTQQRTIKRSGEWFKKLVNNNGF